MGYDVLVRICEGLGIPRGMMGLAYDGVTESAPIVESEVDEEMKRRALLAVGSVALLGAPVLGELLHIPTRRRLSAMPGSRWPTRVPTMMRSSRFSSL